MYDELLRFVEGILHIGKYLFGTIFIKSFVTEEFKQ